MCSMCVYVFFFLYINLKNKRKHSTNTKNKHCSRVELWKIYLTMLTISFDETMIISIENRLTCKLILT